MMNKKYALIFLGTVLVMVLQFCKPAQTTTADTKKNAPPVVLVSYEKDIRPIMLEKCTPCHFPEQGKKKMLDTYEAAKGEANAMVSRVKLSPEDPKFMPFRSKKPALTEKELQLFTDWLAQGTPN